jgi:hypothetical protein
LDYREQARIDLHLGSGLQYLVQGQNVGRIQIPLLRDIEREVLASEGAGLA